MRFNKAITLLVLLITPACGIMDDLLPSGKDERGESMSLAPGDSAPEFSMPDIWGVNHTLAGELTGRRGAVIYFTMWCPICDSHMQSILHNVMPNHPDAAFLAVDYVSGSVESASGSAMAGGYAHSAFTILVDERARMAFQYGATMGTTVVVNSSGIVRMIDDYRGEERLNEALNGL